MSCSIKKTSGYLALLDKVAGKFGDTSKEAVAVANALVNEGYDSYKNKLVEIVDKWNMPDVKKLDTMEMVYRYINTHKLVPGEYNWKTHTIHLADGVSKEELAEDVETELRVNLFEQMYSKPIHESTAGEMKRVNDLISGINNTSVRNMVDAIYSSVKAGASHTMLHEYIHAGAYLYMKVNPDDRLTKQVKDMYDLALDNEVLIDSTVDSKYWKENVDEFLAEALSNRQLIKVLQGINVRNTSDSVLTRLVRAIAKMLGIATDSNVYKTVLEGFVQMAKAGTGKAKVEQASTKQNGAIIEDIQNTEVANMLFREASKCK